MACKLEDGMESDTTYHKFVDLKNRGQLLMVTSDADLICPYYKK